VFYLLLFDLLDIGAFYIIALRGNGQYHTLAAFWHQLSFFNPNLRMVKYGGSEKKFIVVFYLL